MLTMEGAEGRSAPFSLLSSCEEDREEHDTFREGRAQNRLNQNLRGRARIASDCFGRLHADHTHTDGRAERRRCDVKIPSSFS